MIKRSVISFVFIICILYSKAQPGCPQIDAGNNVTLPCTQSCTTLNATLFQAGATTSYTVTSIPYAPPFPFTGGTQIFINIDDRWSNVINLPFSFCFYGNLYNQIVIGTNGLLTFDVSWANNFCQWRYNAPIPTPGPPPAGIYNNSINGAYHDIDPSVGVISFLPPFITYPANINYAVLGTAPCRTFVVNFSTVPHYQCNNLITTQQIVLYETTNVIEVYIQNKPTCSTWNNGNAVIGLQNADGTQGIAAPGRNTGPWTASNEAWRFTPNGPPIWSVTWYDNQNNVVGNTPSISVCPSATTTYRAEALYTPCSGGTPVRVTDSVTVTVTGLQVNIDSSRNVSCFGGSNGYARATFSNATGSVSYGWSNGSSSLAINNLTAGTYVFSATDADNCTRRDTVIIAQPQPLVVNVPDSTISNCSGTGTASFTATPSGGTSPYNYLWNTTPPQNTQTINNVISGTYTVTVTDANGCTATDSGTLTVQQVNNLTISLQNQTNVSCYGYSDGSLTVAAGNGAPPYSYTWSTNPPQNTATATNLAHGNYTVSVSDASGCTNTASYIITQPAPFTAVIDSYRNISCYGANDGYARVAVNGGVLPVNIVWNTNPPQNSVSVNNLTAGVYVVTATDQNNCISADTINIIEPTELILDITAFEDVSCYGRNDGSATATVTGGAPPYTIVWNTTPPQNTLTASNMQAGFYTVMVTDNHGCSRSDTATIHEPQAIILNVLHTTDVSCFGFNDGSATIAASGGTAPYNYEWNSDPPQYTATASNLYAGNYQVTVTDNDGCTTVTPVTINQPSQLLLSITSKNDITCYGYNDGSATVMATGGTPPYSFQWQSGLQGNANVSQLTAGSYEVTVSDSNGCTSSLTIDITEPSPLLAYLTATDISCYGYNDGTISINATGGTPGYDYLWSMNNNFSNAMANNLPAGNYTITITDQNGCDTILSASIAEPLPILISLPDSFTMQHGDTLSLTNSYSGGVGNISFTWWPVAGLSCSDCQIPDAFPPYTTGYVFSVTDEAGCTASASTVVAVLIDKTIYIPNAFSPNEDRINDYFFVQVQDVTEYELKIFNRWGELVFMSNNPKQGWDGTYKGKPLPPSVFVYQVRMTFPDGEKKSMKGSLVLIR
jgi:gliding motility-associated-like protein